MYDNMKTAMPMDAAPVPRRETVGSHIEQTYEAVKATLCVLNEINNIIYGQGNLPELKDGFSCMMDALMVIQGLTMVCRDMAEHIKEGL